MKVPCSYRIAVGAFVLMATLPPVTQADDGLLGRIEALERTIAVLERTIKNEVRIQDVPAGTIAAYAGTEIPPGWLIADGRYLKRSDYPRLFEAINTTFGSLEGGAKFRLPELRGYFIRGFGRAWTRDSDKSRKFGSSQESQTRGHLHWVDLQGKTGEASMYLYDRVWGSGEAISGWDVKAERVRFETTKFAIHHREHGKDKEVDDFHLHTHWVNIRGRTDPEGGSESRPHNVALYYIIKY